VAKTLYLSSQNTVDCYKSFCSISKFWSPTQLFFLSWNIGSIIPLVSITYLALLHTIKYIYFISPRQSASMHLVTLSKWCGGIIVPPHTKHPPFVFFFVFANFSFFFFVFFSTFLFFLFFHLFFYFFSKLFLLILLF